MEIKSMHPGVLLVDFGGVVKEDMVQELLRVIIANTSDIDVSKIETLFKNAVKQVIEGDTNIMIQK